MSDLRTAAQQALEALGKWSSGRDIDAVELNDLIATLEAALEQREQEPVAWIQSNHLQQAQREPFLCRVEPTKRCSDFVPIYTHPPRREWASLTVDETMHLMNETAGNSGWADEAHIQRLRRAIEAALKEKNNG